MGVVLDVIKAEIEILRNEYDKWHDPILCSHARCEDCKARETLRANNFKTASDRLEALEGVIAAIKAAGASI
jgi:hypothetical protein